MTSIFSKTTALFLFALLILTGSFFALDRLEKTREVKQFIQSVGPMFHLLKRHHRYGSPMEEVEEELARFDFLPVVSEEERSRVKAKGEPLRFMPEPPFKRKPPPMEVVRSQGRIYLVLALYDGEKRLYRYNRDPHTLPIWPLYGLLVALFSGFYWSILRSLRPVKPLLEQVRRFSEGDLEVRTATGRKDEIGRIAEAFDDAIGRIRELVETRRLFIRNIMHEFKTPIAAGKIATSMVEPAKYREKLEKAFARKEKLLEEFYRVESIVSGTLELNMAPHALRDLLDAANDLLLEDRGEVLLCDTDLEIDADFTLFSTALKNLLDNGLRYAPDKTVACTVTEERVLKITNRGEPLPHPLETYAHPYAMQGSKERESRGFGFGLYIAWHLFRLHGYPLEYAHRDGVNTFSITLQPVQ